MLSYLELFIEAIRAYEGAPRVFLYIREYMSCFHFLLINCYPAVIK